VVAKVCESGVSILDFSGGEPMLRKDLFVLAKKAKEYGCIVSMNTNGTLFDEEKADEASRLFDYIVISLDGPREVHDRLRGVRGSYDRALTALDLLKQRGMRVGINMVITPTNLGFLPSLIEEIKERADFLTIQPVNPCNHTLNYDEMAVERLRGVLLKLREKGLVPLPIPYIEGMFSYLRCKAPKVCDAVRLYFAISPMGDVLACGARNDIVLGNLFEKGLGEILNRPSLRAIERVNRCRGCWLTCTSGVSLAFRRPLQEIKGYIRLRV
jgi:MoaA/NifB/PqqE/SkfB family radical SAM enzyme